MFSLLVITCVLNVYDHIYTFSKLNPSFNYTGLHFFVGGRNINRRQPGGDWRWIKNGAMTKMSYFAFGAGQPNGVDRQPQDCMFFYALEHYRFHDVHCDYSYKSGYICEK